MEKDEDHLWQCEHHKEAEDSSRSKFICNQIMDPMKKTGSSQYKTVTVNLIPAGMFCNAKRIPLNA
jgi:hypothetical protein